jgi:hypothetical protein
VKNTVDARNARQRGTAEKLWPFFRGAKSARQSLTQYFTYTRRAFIAQRNAEFAAREAQAARADADTESAKARPHRDVVDAHLDGNDRAKELFGRLVNQRKALWTAMHLSKIKTNQLAAITSAIKHLEARIAEQREGAAASSSSSSGSSSSSSSGSDSSADAGNTGAEVPQAPNDESTLLEDPSMMQQQMAAEQAQQQQMAAEQAQQQYMAYQAQAGY